MIRIDGFYLYSAGFSIHPLVHIQPNVAFTDWFVPLLVAQNALEGLINQSIFQPQISRIAGMKLLDIIKGLTADAQRTAPINPYEAYQVSSALVEFEHVVSAELGNMNIYLVAKKRGYDTTDLTERGAVLFPPELNQKVPEAIHDIEQATKCIAFQLSTAAGFHLHRANESVLHRYYDAVTNGAERPNTRNIGDYLAALREKKAGDEKVLSALKDLKDLHRNPLIHPDDSLDDIDEAIALMGSIHAVVTLMLKAIPFPQQQPQLAANAST